MDKDDLWSSYSVKDIGTSNITPAKFRELVLNRLLSSGPGTISSQMPSTKELDTISDMLYEAISAGRFFDFGHWPNDFIKKQSARASDLYYENALGHPFSRPWIFYHTWSDVLLENKFNWDGQMTSIYLVNPFPEGNKPVGCDFEVTGIENFTVQNTEILGVGDRGILYTNIARDNDAAYVCNIAPVQLRFPIQYWNDYAIKTGLEAGVNSATHAAASNIIEPTMVALLLINTKGIPRETITASDKLNKARIKNKKHIIPPHIKIHTQEYINIAMRSPARRESLGGHHASPVTHIRIGHWRNYKSGERTFINDTLVKATPEMREMFKSNRAGYKYD